MRQASFILLRPVLLTVLMMCAGLPVRGQDGPVTYQGGVALTAAGFKRQVVDSGGSIGLHLHAEPRLYRVLAVRIEGGVDYLGRLCFDADGGCAEGRRASSSDTFMLSGSVAAGMLTPPVYLGTRAQGADVAVGLFAGREGVRAGIGQGDCINCRAPGVDLRGGFYLEPVFEVWFFPGFGMNAGYRIYQPASDVHRRFTVRFIVTDER